MRAHFFWPDCTLDMLTMAWQRHARPVFWVSATPEELADKVSTFWSPEQVLAFQQLSPTMIEDSYLIDARYFFFVPANDIGSLQRADPPVLSMWVYPYSGMWDGRRPWIPIGPPKGLVGKDGSKMVLAEEPVGVELDELSELRFDLINKNHLAPSAV